MDLAVKRGTHRFEGAPFLSSPDQGGPLTPELVVLHYTGGGAASGSIDWLTRRDEVYVSAHVVVARDGAVTQLVPFNRRAFHAGRSHWCGRSALNGWTVGIELANYGRCKEARDGRLITWTGAVLPRSRCVRAVHKHGGPPAWWEAYPEAQVAACVAVCRALRAAYALAGLVGHDDVAPGRKVDPGPALDLEAIRAAVFA